MEHTHERVSDNPRDYTLSPRFTSWRPGQREAIECVLSAFLDDGKQFVALSAPTGSGKSLSAIAIATELRSEGPVAILTQTKSLQDQYHGDFSEDTVDFRGKSNYECQLLEYMGMDIHAPRPCADITKLIATAPEDNTQDLVEQKFGQIIMEKGRAICPVRSHGNCMYYQRKHSAMSAHSVYVTNYANYMGLVNYDQTFAAAHTLILDEAHNIDDAVESYAELTLSAADILRLECETPPWFSDKTPEQRQPDWDEWRLKLSDYSTACHAKWRDLDERRRSLTSTERGYFRFLDILMRKLGMMLGVKGGYHVEWKPQMRPRVRKDPYTGTGSWHFRPFMPGQMAKYVLYKDSPHVLFMSATMERSQVLQFGIEEEELEWVEQPSAFPARNSRIYVGRNIRYGKPFTFRNEGNVESIKEWVAHLDSMLERLKAKGHRTLVIVPAKRHVDHISQHSRHSDDMLFHRNDFGTSKQTAIDSFNARSGWCVLVGAFDIAEGHSFDGPTVEATVFPKLWSPPDFNEALNKYRVKQDPLYNERRKARWFAQAVGRGTRSETDINHILVLDNGADNWMAQTKRLLPVSVQERF